jgi:hypothetical protein
VGIEVLAQDFFGFELAFSFQLTSVVDMSFDIPMSIRITRVVVLGASHLNLLETPLRQVDITGTEIATQYFMLETEGGCQGSDSASVTRGGVSDNFDLPVIFLVANGKITVARHFTITLGHGSRHFVGMQVSASLGVDQSNDCSVGDESKVGLFIVFLLATIRVEEPVIVGIFVMITGNLLLCRAFRVGLDVRVQETASIAHVLDCSTRSIGDL